MGLLDRLFGARRAPAKRTITWDQAASVGLIENSTTTGVTVSETTALGLSALWCGLKVISQDVGSLSPVLYREGQDGTRDPATDHPLFPVLAEVPNREHTRPVFFETLQAHALLYGNAFAEVERNGAGQPIALWPIHPSLVQVVRTTDGNLLYRVMPSPYDHDPTNAVVELQPEDVIHVPGLSADGTVGYRLLTIARETFGFGLATMRYGSYFFANGSRPSGVLTTQGQLNDTARENLRTSWASLHTGTSNTGKVAILEEGLNFTPFSLTNEQSQYTDVLNWFVYEVARFLNCPPSKLHSLDKATWGNLETLNQDYLTTTLRPWLVKWEQELERKLLTPAERASLYVEFDTTQLLRADIATRYGAYATALASGFLTVDEVRARENMPPLPKPEPAPAPPMTPAPTIGTSNGNTPATI